MIPSLAGPQHACTDARAQLFARSQSFMHAFISSVQRLCNRAGARPAEAVPLMNSRKSHSPRILRRTRNEDSLPPSGNIRGIRGNWMAQYSTGSTLLSKGRHHEKLPLCVNDLSTIRIETSLGCSGS